MNGILNYQSSEYDCGPVTLTNALRFLFPRIMISPDLLRGIFLYTLDTFNEHGESGRYGTSRASMNFMSEWLNAYGKTRSFPIGSRYLRGADVSLAEDGDLIAALSGGGVVVIRTMLDEVEHYVLLTGIDRDGIALFDPYEEEAVYFEQESPSRGGIRVVSDEPRRCNRVVSESILKSTEGIDYAFGPVESREAVIVYNLDTYTGQR